MSASSFLRLGGLIAAYKIVPDEIDEIKVKIVHTVLYLLVYFESTWMIFILANRRLWCTGAMKKNSTSFSPPEARASLRETSHQR